MADIFSVVAMFIMFREALEASVVIAIMLQMCQRLGLIRCKRQVWYGALSGIVISVVLGVCFIIIFYVAKQTLFQGTGKAIFFGYVSLLAALLITLLAFAMLRFMNYEKKWERKLTAAAQKSALEEEKRAAAAAAEQGGHTHMLTTHAPVAASPASIDASRTTAWAVFLLAFSSVFREGVESVIFLAGVSGASAPTAIPLSAVVGVIVGCLVGVILYYSGKQIKDLAWFFVASCIFLFFIAAGLVARAMQAWQDIGWFGVRYPVYDAPWWNVPAWDTSGCCSSNISENKFFGLMNALFGYSDSPTFVSLFAYFGFWALVVLDVIVKWRRGMLLDAMAKTRRREAREAARAARKQGATTKLADMDGDGLIKTAPNVPRTCDSNEAMREQMKLGDLSKGENGNGVHAHDPESQANGKH
ncbi:hypothetical protein WJX81_001676 [Elliptochloris bilobata]|uniref:Uncharacterized protein n=1 Tax=Elliptochloris bilobata TaxID=381761 RepID=A0AAW1RE01_9CHLO